MVWDECDLCFEAYPTGSAHECPQVVMVETPQYDPIGERADEEYDACRGK